MRDGLGGIALRQKCKTQQLVSRRRVGTELQCSLKWSDSRAVIVFLHISRAEIQEGICRVRVNLRSFTKLRNLSVHLVLLAGFKACLQVFESTACRGLTRQG